MSFHIILVYYIKSVFITKLKESRTVGIMWGTDSVHIGFLHQFNIIAHNFFRHISAGFAVKFMPVRALEHNPLTVDTDDTLFNFNTSETYFLADILNRYSVILKSQHQCVKIRTLWRPWLYIGNNCLESGIMVLVGILGVKRNCFAGGINYTHINA